MVWYMPKWCKVDCCIVEILESFLYILQVLNCNALGDLSSLGSFLLGRNGICRILILV